MRSQIHLLTTAIATVLVSCSSALGFLGPVTVEPNPNPAVPLAAIVRFSADRPVTTSIHVTDGKNEWTLDYDGSHEPSKGLPVVGMRPNRKHEIRVTVRDAKGGVVEAGPFEHITPPLPEVGDDFPPIHVVVTKPEKMEPGICTLYFATIPIFCPVMGSTR
jgi:arylsulfate sulfotransferase